MRAALERLFPLTADENEFLTALRERGEIRPELLTDNSELASHIAAQPMLRWRAQQRGRAAPEVSAEDVLG